MTAGALLDAIERAARAAFPDRAASLVAVVERRLWFGPSARTERPLDEEQDVEIAASRLDDGCSICGRHSVDWSQAVMGIGGRFERYDHERSWEVRHEGGTLRLPLAVCGACRVAGSESPDHDGAALSDLVRALRAAGPENERTITELERRFSEPELPAVDAPCLSCGAPPPAAGHRGGLCAGCWQRARTVAP